MGAIKGANLALMFLLELGVLVGVCVWGFTLPSGPITRIVAGVGTPALFLIMWALFGAAKDARFRLVGGWRVALELLWFGGGALAWYEVAGWMAGVGFFALWTITAVVRAGWQGGLIVDVP
ncbi:YrdB family protein [Nocardia australiensis]|uniref:YrdB family protein n=1 Tax=Nocardia australiensis TaxID=2887191 RepID=UPI001D15DE7A|nr:YrdB family protein [Nocardia australiensis]